MHHNHRHGHKSGGKASPEYQAWAAMRCRCSNSRDPHWPRYGGRGIRVCERWDSFESFLADLGPRPSPSHSLDRIDSDGNYEPTNCRWATKAEQSRNRSISKLTEGDVRLIRHWLRQGYKQRAIASIFGVHVMTISKIKLRTKWADIE